MWCCAFREDVTLWESVAQLVGWRTRDQKVPTQVMVWSLGQFIESHTLLLWVMVRIGCVKVYIQIQIVVMCWSSCLSVCLSGWLAGLAGWLAGSLAGFLTGWLCV